MPSLENMITYMPTYIDTCIYRQRDTDTHYMPTYIDTCIYRQRDTDMPTYIDTCIYRQRDTHSLNHCYT